MIELSDINFLSIATPHQIWQHELIITLVACFMVSYERPHDSSTSVRSIFILQALKRSDTRDSNNLSKDCESVEWIWVLEMRTSYWIILAFIWRFSCTHDDIVIHSAF